ncbi:MAG: class I SAM-dependent methyltransferase [Acidobacteriota bacterium]
MPSRTTDYESFYQTFDSPLMQQVRREAYGEDIGQHSWTSAGELRADVARLRLSSSSRVIDLGCGPCGPLTFVIAAAGCRGTGVDASACALRAGRARASARRVEQQLSVAQADLNASLPFSAGCFDAAMSFDVVLHLPDRLKLFREVARLLQPGGRFLFTDAGVLTGVVSSEDVRRRSVHGESFFVAPGWNDRLLAAADLGVIETEDRTGRVLTNASGRLAAMLAHRGELEQQSSPAEFERYKSYLDTVLAMSRTGGLSRVMYLAEKPS